MKERLGFVGKIKAWFQPEKNAYVDEDFEKLSKEAKLVAKACNLWTTDLFQQYQLKGVLDQNVLPLLATAVREVAFQQGYYRKGQDRLLDDQTRQELETFYGKKRQESINAVHGNISSVLPASSSLIPEIYGDLCVYYYDTVFKSASKMSLMHASKNIIQIKDEGFQEEQKTKMHDMAHDVLNPQIRFIAARVKAATSSF